MTAGEKPAAEVVYRLHDGRAYVNLTSRCPLRCRFCFKWQDRPDFFGHPLAITRDAEPDVEVVDRAIRGAPPHSELVFCGLGEPLERFAAVLELAKRYRLRDGGRVRVNTCGAVTPTPTEAALHELSLYVDSLCVSLNAPDRQCYDALCRPLHPGAHEALLLFIERARRHFSMLLLTAVPYPGVDIESCRRFAHELGLPFGVRPYSVPEDEEWTTRPPPTEGAG